MCDKAVDTFSFVFDSVPDRYKTPEMCDKAVSNDSFMLKYYLYRYKTQETCDKVIDDFLPASKFVLNWFVTNKMIKKLHNASFAGDDILFLDKDSGNVTYFSDEMGILSVDLNIINLDDVNFYKDYPETIIHVRLMALCNRFKKRKAFKKI